MRKIAALTMSIATVGATWLTMSPAEAHTPNISATCDGVRVAATSYDANQANRWSVTIGGETKSGTFGASFDQTFPVPQDGASTAWSATIDSHDNVPAYHGDEAGTVGPCGTPPPVDECVDLPGTQPEGTECTPPPDVERTDAKALEGCDVVLDGTSYGAGELTYDELYTDTYVFNEQTNTFDLVTDTTAEIVNPVFTEWTTQELVENGCDERADQPPAEHSSQQSTELNCDDEVQVTTTVATTTPYVYDAATNSWVPGQPVEQTTTDEQPTQPGDCDDTGVLPNQENTQDEDSAQVLPASAVAPQVPTAVNAGLASATPATDAVSASNQANDTRTPVLLLLLAGALLSLGAFRLRRS